MTETMRNGTDLDSSTLRVRRATVADLSTVVELRLALLREYGDHPVYGRIHPDVEARARPVFEQQIKASDQAIFLAEREGKVVGIARGADVRGSPLLLPERYCYVTSVYVRPDHRHQGVLSLLIRHVEEWAQSNGLTEMRLHNSTSNAAARVAWERLGFVINEEVRLKPVRR